MPSGVGQRAADRVSRPTSLNSLRAEIVRLEEQLMAYEDRLRLTDILGGIGYIVGITGAAYYYLGCAAEERLTMATEAVDGNTAPCPPCFPLQPSIITLRILQRCRTAAVRPPRGGLWHRRSAGGCWWPRRAVVVSLRAAERRGLALAVAAADGRSSGLPLRIVVRRLLPLERCSCCVDRAAADDHARHGQLWRLGPAAVSPRGIAVGGGHRAEGECRCA